LIESQRLPELQPSELAYRSRESARSAGAAGICQEEAPVAIRDDKEMIHHQAAHGLESNTRMLAVGPLPRRNK
jgi:hypothetical protein